MTSQRFYALLAFALLAFWALVGIGVWGIAH